MKFCFCCSFHCSLCIYYCNYFWSSLRTLQLIWLAPTNYTNFTLQQTRPFFAPFCTVLTALSFLSTTFFSHWLTWWSTLLSVTQNLHQSSPSLTIWLQISPFSNWLQQTTETSMATPGIESTHIICQIYMPIFATALHLFQDRSTLLLFCFCHGHQGLHWSSKSHHGLPLQAETIHQPCFCHFQR